MHIFIFVVVCLSFALSLAFAIVLKYNYLTTAALFFIVVADIFLLLLGYSYYAIGLIFFNIVQLLYATKIFLNRDNKRYLVPLIIQVALRLITAIIAVIVVGLILEFHIVIVLASIYGTNFLYNLVFVGKRFKRDIMFGIGLILFALCDIFVVTLNLPYHTNITINHTVIFALMAICYIPSQLIIALSTAHKHPSLQL
ncbi:MAG: hypothetical protein FWC80_04685 [Firmicutes bacterium]|nr:hypothetical protein [Bacillota bacterium]